MGLEEKLPEGILTTSLEGLVNWGRQNSTWPLLFGLGFGGDVTKADDVPARCQFSRRNKTSAYSSG